MTEPTLTEVFGVGATQTATTITLLKSDFASLTASATNRADSLLVAILLQAKNAMTKAAFDADIDHSIYIESSYPGFVFRGTSNTSYRVDRLTVNLAKPDTSSIIDPDDY